MDINLWMQTQLQINTALGYASLGANTAAENTAVGSHSMVTNSTGIKNAAFGAWSLRLNTSGDYNTGVGYQ